MCKRESEGRRASVESHVARFASAVPRTLRDAA